MVWATGQLWISYITYWIILGSFLALAWSGHVRGYTSWAWFGTLALANFLVLALLEQLVPRLQSVDLRNDDQKWNDAAHGVLVSIASLLDQRLAEIIGVGLVVASGGVLEGLFATSLWPTSLPFAAQVAVGVVLWALSADVVLHRAYHRIDALWRIHELHHDAPAMHVLVSARQHVLEGALNALFGVLPLVLLGAPGGVIWWTALWTVLVGNQIHSNVDQRFPKWLGGVHYLLPTPQFHYVHHSRHGEQQLSNFSGFVPWLDLVTGSHRHPDRNPVAQVGLAQSSMPKTFAGQLAHPFRKNG